RAALAAGQPDARGQGGARSLDEPARGDAARHRALVDLRRRVGYLWRACRHRRSAAGHVPRRVVLQRRPAHRERVLDRGARRARQRFRIADRRVRGRLSRDDDRLSDVAGLSYDPRAAAAGCRNVHTAARPARPALEATMQAVKPMTSLFTRIVTSRTVWICLFVIVIASTLPLYVSGYILGLLTIAYYFGVFSMAWDLLFGFAGEVNFGPTFLIWLGAYTTGILDNLYQPPIWLCLIAGAFAAVAGGVVLALPALRVRGPYFGLTTLVAVLILQNFIVVAASLTGGEIGLTVPDVISISDNVNYWIALGFMSVSGVILYSLSRSPVGLILQASGQDAMQAGALGFNVTKHKLTAFIISALFSGLAGALMVFYLGAASVGTFVDVTVGVQVIIGAVLGGRRTILGAVLGAVFLIAMSEALRPLGDLSNFVVFAIALVVVLLFPSGFFGLLTRTREQA